MLPRNISFLKRQLIVQKICLIYKTGRILINNYSMKTISMQLFNIPYSSPDYPLRRQTKNNVWNGLFKRVIRRETRGKVIYPFVLPSIFATILNSMNLLHQYLHHHCSKINKRGNAVNCMEQDLRDNQWIENWLSGGFSIEVQLTTD